MRAWLWLIPAVATEVGWVSGLNAASGPWGWAGTLACALASVVLAVKAARTLPATTVYILFMGLGSLGAVLVDTLVFDTPIGAPALACLALLLTAVIGLKRSSNPVH